MKCVAIMGATATGKTAAAVELCGAFGGEVVSMDSRQVYRGLDIGTGKPSPEERRAARHHLIDVAAPEDTWSAGRHAAAAAQAMDDIARAAGVPFLVGGTGLYFRALLGGLANVAVPPDVSARLRAAMALRRTRELYDELARRDPPRASQVSRRDRVRITRALEIMDFAGRPVSEIYAEQRAADSRYAALRIVLTMPRPRLRKRIADRTRGFFSAGWVDEVQGLLADGVSPDAPGMRSLGYGEIAAALASGGHMDAVADRVILRTQQYAKRQETFFRGEAGATWVDVTEPGWIRRLEAEVRASIST